MQDMEDDKIGLARKYCEHYHQGKFRKGSNLPASSHPIAVAEILARNGYSDEVIQCIALMHDVLEDGIDVMDKIQENFGYEISNGVYTLSRNKGKLREGIMLTEDEYWLRLSFARRKIRKVKIADAINNTCDLEVLDKDGIERKLKEAEQYLIPWGKDISPIMVKELIANIENYRIKMLDKAS